ncbi:uncharacterized protein LOC106090935 [Stomoxys calcitrans]|uniref:Uncharacterized protein n=1 Tax=Stomoxys calcitrans TaxID=35570 RepID=A0A1I8Q5T5_STOCA|nr:uncharacterized protein LOC106090935 [Stomoxys calcitrans]
MKFISLTLAVIISASMAVAAVAPYLPPKPENNSFGRDKSSENEVFAASAPAALYAAPSADSSTLSQDHAIPKESSSASATIPVILALSPVTAAATLPIGQIAPSIVYGSQGGLIQAGSVPALQYLASGQIVAGPTSLHQSAAIVPAASSAALQYFNPGISTITQPGGFLQAAASPTVQYIVPSGVSYGHIQAASAPIQSYAAPASGQIFLAATSQPGGFIANGGTRYALNGGYANKIKK